MTEHRRSRTDNGFTLIEVLLVIVIIGILSLGVVMQVRGRSRQAAINTTRISIASVVSAVDAFEIDNGSLPSSLSELVTSTGQPTWAGPYVRGGKVPSDAWGVQLQYSRSGETIKVSSAGPDKQHGSGDDLTN